MLTAKKFAERAGITYPTVIAWLKKGLIPDAVQEETPVGMIWQIPVASLAKVRKQKTGPKPKNADSTNHSKPAEDPDPTGQSASDASAPSVPVEVPAEEPPPEKPKRGAGMKLAKKGDKAE